MKIYHLLTFAILFTMISCGSKETSEESRKEEKLADIIKTFGFLELDTAKYPYETIIKLETQDRDSYSPVSFETVLIQSDGEIVTQSHGKGICRYYLAIENYNSNAEAEKRAKEYNDRDRLAEVTGLDRNDLSKSTVRCWGLASGNRAYLLTTTASMHSGIEAEKNSVMKGIKAYIESPLETQK